MTTNTSTAPLTGDPTAIPPIPVFTPPGPAPHTALISAAAPQDATDSLGVELPPWITCVPIEWAADHRAIYDEITGTETRYMNITPELASTWLARYNDDTGNRPEDPRTRASYANDMTGNRWPFTGDKIAFGRQESPTKPPALFDGQHRLGAIVESGVTQRMEVIRGLVHAARGVMDAGNPRSLVDALMMARGSSEGVRYDKLLVAVGRRAAYWTEGVKLPSRFGGKDPAGIQRALTRLEILGFVMPRLTELGHAARRGFNLWHHTKVPPTIGGFVYWLAEGVDTAGAATFFEQLELAARWRAGNLPPSSPIFALLRRLKTAQEAAEKQRRGSKVDPADTLNDAGYLYLLLRAWVLFRSDRPTQVIQLPWRPDDRPDPASFPDPALILGERAGIDTGVDTGDTDPADPADTADTDPAGPAADDTMAPTP